MKVFGIILIIIGAMSLFGSLISDTPFAIEYRIMGGVIQIGMIVIGIILLAKSNKK